MDKNEKVQFVTILSGEVVGKIVARIESDQIPEHWDAIELRQYLADKFEEAIMSGTMSRTRRHRYYDDYINRNL